MMLHIMHMAIRKMAHVAEFGLLSASVFHGVRGAQWLATQIGGG
jgi:hypothetical protein